MKKNNKKGFTLAELLIVVAIIAVLVAIAIPIFTSQLEKSREAVDQANIRDAYAQLVAATLTEETSITSTSTKITFTDGTAASSGSAYVPPTATVTATQQVTGWASGDNPVIAGASVAPSINGWDISVNAATGVATIKAK